MSSIQLHVFLKFLIICSLQLFFREKWARLTLKILKPLRLIIVGNVVYWLFACILEKIMIDFWQINLKKKEAKNGLFWEVNL